MKVFRHLEQPSHGGFTQIELLVALSIITLLMALIVPAIHNSRENSRQVHCRNNLRQLITAATAYESVRREFPFTSVRYRDSQNGGPTKPSISPHAKMLAHLDQQPLADRIDFKYSTLDRPGHLPECYARDPRTGYPNYRRPICQDLLTTTVEVFLCPSDSGYPGGNNYRACMGIGAGVLEKGPRLRFYCEGSGTGAFVHGRGTRVVEFKDGLSQTVFFSEQLIGDGDPSRYTPWRDVYYTQAPHSSVMCGPDSAARECRRYARADAEHDSYVGTTWLFGGWRHGWYNHILTPNATTPDCSMPRSQGGGWGAYTARSFHPGGVNVALGDGSVKMVNEGISLAVWRALATRAGGEVEPLH